MGVRGRNAGGGGLMLRLGAGVVATYVASSRDMLDIVFGAAARGDVAEVQFFVDYLNLRDSTAAQGQVVTRDER